MKDPSPRLALLAVALAMMVVSSFGFGLITRLNNWDESQYAPPVVLAGLLAGLLYWHRRRGLGLAVAASLGAMICSFIAAARMEWTAPLIAAAAFCLGVVFIRCLLASLEFLRGTAWLLGAFPCLAFCLCLVFLGAAIEAPPLKDWRPPKSQFTALPIATGLLVGLAVLWLLRPTIELALEPFLWLMYRVKAAGPGLAAVPPRGPCIVIANHACWFDPLFLAKVLPRPITPMMTSRFFDLRLLRPILRHVFHVIRVPEQQYKKQETPDEIREAIAALDRGECLVLFPEGFLRRSDDKPLRRFGRGIWQILAARPDTPVFCCWIEGAWGSWASYWNGKPTKNKKPDVRRRISVAVPEPVVVDAATLGHHLATRLFLMNRVLESRKLLGLPELPPIELPKDETDGNEA